MSNKIFDVVQVEKPNRNAFDLTFDYKTTCNMAELVPCCIQECIPGDRFTLGSQSLVRFAPMIAPTMQRYDARIEYFFVPYRLLWDNWMSWIATDPGAGGFLSGFPTLTINSSNWNPLCDRMGIPDPSQSGTPQSENVNAMPFAAYQLIYDTYYKDQNLQTSVFTKLVDGLNNANTAYLTYYRRRAWEHDYFTSCLPFAQKGNPVTIGTTNYGDVAVKWNPAGPGNPNNGTVTGVTNTDGVNSYNITTVAEATNGISVSGLYADTSELDALSVTINDLREAEALQKWLEINARAGTRPNEVIAGHFGVKSSDARLQRPEYIVGVKQPVSVSEVLNTADTFDAGTNVGRVQGDMAGHGVAMIDDENYGSFFCEEHGIIMGIFSVMPKTSYQQGLNKLWLKTTDATQYFFPSFAHLGEQPVLNKEIYAFQGAAGNQTFGYLPAFQDYRFNSNMVTGRFRDQLSYWTAGRIFDTPPALNAEFIEGDPRKDIFAVTDESVDCLYVHILNKIFASRLIPVYGTPTL